MTTTVQKAQRTTGQDWTLTTRETHEEEGGWGMAKMKLNGAIKTKPGFLKKKTNIKKFLEKLKFVQKAKINSRIPLNASVNNIYVVIIIQTTH